MRSLKKLSVVIISLFMVFVCLPVNSFAENTANTDSVPAVELTAEDCMENNDEVEEEAICEEETADESDTESTVTIEETAEEPYVIDETVDEAVFGDDSALADEEFSVENETLSALEDTEQAPVRYIDENDEEAICEEYTLLSEVYQNFLSAKNSQKAKTVTLKGGWYVLDRDVTFPDRIELEKYTDDSDPVCIILCDGNTLTAEKGIHNSANNRALNIYGQQGNNGNLVATWNDTDRQFDYDHSPIGSNGYGVKNKEAGGDLMICGGNIYAESYGASAAIGGGQSGGMGWITITGGNVYASGYHGCGPGIGTGLDYNGWGGKLLVTGGHVESTGAEYYCDGIGGNFDANPPACIEITGGTVIATGGWGDVNIPPRSMRANEIKLGSAIKVSGSHMPDDEKKTAKPGQDGPDERESIIRGNRYSVTEAFNR